MQDIINGDNVYFHCRIGADRTGTLAYLLEGLLGVQDEDRYEEYELTYLSGHVDRARYYKQKATDNAKKFVYMMGYVLHTQDIYDWYMAGTTDEDADKALIQDFRDAMINYN
jgi:protein tyrosine/serine phosphatase